MLRREEPPLVAVVRLRKHNEWALPKGKLERGETPRAAAIREVMEETGHDVAVHEFLGTLVYDVRDGSKVVHYWRMEAAEAQTRASIQRSVQARTSSKSRQRPRGWAITPCLRCSLR